MSLTISAATPTLTLTDTTASAKSFEVVVDGNIVDFRESSIVGSKSGLWIDLASVPDNTTGGIKTAQINVGDNPAGNEGTSRVEITSRRAEENILRLSGMAGQTGAFLKGYKVGSVEAYFIIDAGGAFQHDVSQGSYQAFGMFTGGGVNVVGQITRINTNLPQYNSGVLMGIIGGPTAPLYITQPTSEDTVPALIFQPRWEGAGYNFLEFRRANGVLKWAVDNFGRFDVLDAHAYQVNGVSGVDGTFTTADAKTVTVTKGIITSIT